LIQINTTIEPRVMLKQKKAETFETHKMPYPENVLVRRRSQIFTDDEPAKIELDPLDQNGWFAKFIERLARIGRNIGIKK
jgi:hypothetical protein